MRLQDRLLRLREGLGLTQTEMAERLDVSKNYIYLIESGKNTPGKKFVLKFEQVESAFEKNETCGSNLLDNPNEQAPKRNLSYLEGVANPFDNASDNDLQAMLLEFIKLKNWGSLVLVAKELQRRELQAVNQQIQQMKNKRERDAG